jgi:hypothetical protein
MVPAARKIIGPRHQRLIEVLLNSQLMRCGVLGVLLDPLISSSRRRGGRPKKASALTMTFVTSDFLNWTEFPVAEGLAEREFQRTARLHVGTHLAFEKAVRIAAL